jgi:hypothetical protein
MPGAPNRPPEKTEAPAPAQPVVAQSAEQKALRRIAPSRVALLQDVWKGSPANDLLVPYDKAETAFSAGDFVAAENALDQLAVRFAEPRWPTLPAPFRDLRVAIPAPQPPQWDPEFALTPEERDGRKIRRQADLQYALAEATVQWAAAHSVDLGDAAVHVTAAKGLLETLGASAEFFHEIDQVWAATRERVPRPKSKSQSAPTARPPAAEPEEA